MRHIHPAGYRSCCLPRSPRARRRSGFTLLEIMIATAITLLMMISLVQVFKVISDSMKQGRAALQMNSTLRSITSRLRHDLSHLTVRVDPPSDTSSGGGYFMYFDGSMTDYTASLFAGDAPRSNRFGDTDDILMFTARAGSSWFTGQVPRYIIEPPIAPAGPDTTPVIITSQLAEIAVFARPIKSPATNAALAFDDNDDNNFPDSFRLHYRVLPIRPDLNTVGTGAQRALPVMNLASGDETPTSMAPLFAICDLSMHRLYDGDATTNDLIAANSLEDLANPANRFAHYQYSLSGLGTAATTTMPLLVLDPIPNTELTAISAGLYPDPNPAGFSGATAQLTGSVGNYLHSAFVLGDGRTGEDVIANNIVAFDVKGFDPGAPVIASPGADGGFGISNGATPPTFTGPAGRDGSDDLILTPNDPGYAAAYNTSSSYVNVSYGEYVDLMWARKALNSLSAYSLNYSNISGNSPNLFTALSGLESAAPLTYTDGLLRSGKVLIRPTSGIFILQPTYDTWTTAFDTNGTSQSAYSTISGTAADLGRVDVNGLVRKNGWATSDTAPPVDRGTDGLDNNGTGGIDEMAERDTMPPFPVKLRGIKVSVRIEDLTSRQVKQMSVATEFATQ